MDSPTEINIHITSNNSDSVKKAALSAQKRIQLNTKGYDEASYIIDSNVDFQAQMNKLIWPFGSCKYTETHPVSSNSCICCNIHNLICI